MYSRKKFKKKESQHQCFFKEGGAEINKNKECSNFLHTYCDAYNGRDLSDRRSVTSTAHLFNSTIIDWCARKKSDTYRSNSITETGAMYTGVLDKNWIRNFYKSIGYPIGPPSKIYEDNQAIIKRVLAERITPQARPIDILITALHELHLRKTSEMLDTRSNMQLADLNSKPHSGKSLRYLIYCVFGVHLYPPPGLEQYKILFLYKFHGPPHINDNHRKNNEKKSARINSILRSFH